jgi:hypothetical protein
VRLWDMQNPGADPVVLYGHAAPVQAITFSPDGRRLATSGDDKTILMWPMQRNDLRELACRTAGRNMTWEEWQKFFGEQVPYRKTCAELPIHPSFIESARALAREGKHAGGRRQI